ncbi:hypothetical protein CBD41_01585 [bacterium TMED181]|nr:hypothetical protein [Planctomycetota bacterium]OUW47075.1 MAG: hypothetical protein CBD41_01585 [bacterium TMED181]
MDDNLIPVQIGQRFFPQTPDMGAIIQIVSESKRFVVCIGHHEAIALEEALQQQDAPRPMTHQLLTSVMLGFDIEVRRAIVTQVVQGNFFGLLVLERKGSDGILQEAHIDCRPSDAFVLSARLGFPLFVTSEVLEEVPEIDVSDLIDASAADDMPDFPGLEINEEE